MLKLFVGGGLIDTDPVLMEKQEEFAASLGQEIVDQGHTLLNACGTTFDAAIAKSVDSRLKEKGDDPSTRLYSYVLAGQEPIHSYGNVLESQLDNWEIGSRRFRVPEPVQLADGVILVGGFAGTFKAANWARFAKKPLLPVSRFGGAAKEIYSEELHDFDTNSIWHISRAEYENLAQLRSPLPDFAKTVVSLAEKARTSNTVFVIMSFANEPALKDALYTFKTVCGEHQYQCNTVSEGNTHQRILPEIWKQIRGCAFTIVDLSPSGNPPLPRPNVYYELGFAEGIGKPLIVTAKEGTELPFDTKDIPVIMWDGQESLREQLTVKVRAIAETQGR